MPCHACDLQELALDAVQCVAHERGNGQFEIDIKNYAKVEKIPGGTIEDCKVLKGTCRLCLCLCLGSYKMLLPSMQITNCHQLPLSSLSLSTPGLLRSCIMGDRPVCDKRV